MAARARVSVLGFRLCMILSQVLMTALLLKPCVSGAQSEDLVEMSEDGFSAANAEPQAVRRQALADAVKKASYKMAADVLSESRVESQKAGLNSKIIPQYEKYIPLIRRGEPTPSDDGFKIHFVFKVSPQSLKALLIDEGFLQLSDRPITLLPLTTISDQTNGTSFVWWFPTPPGINEVEQPHWNTFQKMTARLIEGFAKSGIMVLSPATYHLNRWIPDSLRREKLSNEDFPVFSQITKAQILVTGGLTLERPQPGSAGVHAVVHLAAIPVKQDRPIAEVNEVDDLALAEGASLSLEQLNPILDRATASLVSQVTEVWNRGGVNVETVRLVVEGELTPADLDRVKAGLMRANHGVRAIRDRRFQRGASTYEIDLSGSASEFAQGLSKETLEGFSSRVLEITHDEVRLKIVAKK